MDLSCYENIIGLSEVVCECLPDAPEGYNTSLSGLYLDKLTPLNNINDLSDCSTATDMWEMMSIARDEAIKLFVSDTNALLSKTYLLKRKPFKGSIGQAKHRELVSTQYQYLGVRLRAANILSGVLVIKNIGTIFQATGTVTVYIYDNDNELLETIVLDTTAASHDLNMLATPIELPLFKKYNEATEYFIIYEYSPLNKPYQNKLYCEGCGHGSLSFNTANPYYRNKQTTHGWANWLMVGSHATDSLTTFDDCDAVTSNQMNGLTLDVELRCTVTETLCNNELDFEGNPLAMSMAMAIRYKAAEILADAMIKSGKLNRYTLIDHELFGTSIEEWRTEYKANVDYIVANADIASNDCFTCKETTGLKKQGLFS